MNSPLISVIVPVYNVEQYLDKCIMSIIHQTYNNLDIILVDDGSPDGCGEKCDVFAQLDTRIRVVHKKNGGLSSARNAGLDIAKGDYIGFVDSDDYIADKMYEKMMSLMIEGQCDLVECCVNIIKNGQIQTYTSGEDEIMDGEEATIRHLNGKKNGGIPRVAVWSKLYKKTFWENQRFPEGHIHEDYMLTSKALFEAKRVGIVREGLYYHIADNSGSIMNANFSERDLYLETQHYERIKYYRFQNASEEIINLAETNYYNMLLSLCWRCHYAGMNEEEQIKSKLYQYKKEILNHRLEKKRKLEFVLFYFSPMVYYHFRKIYKKHT